MILRPVRPVSPCGPPMTNVPVGLTCRIIASSTSAAGSTAGSTCSRTSASICSSVTSSLCWVESTTVWTRRGVRRSSSYSMVTWLLASGRRYGIRSVSLRRRASSRRMRCERLSGEGHHLLGLRRRVAEHHALVARALLVVQARALVDALRDVGALAVDGGDDAARVGVEAQQRVGVADVADDAAGDLLHVYVGVGGHLSREHDEAGRDERLDGHARARILREEGVEDGVGDLVGDLVRVSFRDRLGREEVSQGERG